MKGTYKRREVMCPAFWCPMGYQGFVPSNIPIGRLPENLRQTRHKIYLHESGSYVTYPKENAK